MINRQVGYEETTDRDVDYDRIYDQMEEVEGLRPLDREKLNLSVSDLGGGQSGRKDYSLINYEQTEFKFTVIYDFLKFVPKSHKVKVMINGLVRLCQQMLFAPANRRRLRFEEQEAQAKYWQSRLSKEDQGYITEADKLLARWGRQYLLQEQIRRRRLRLGLDVVDGERARWHTCERKKEILEESGHPAALGGLRVLRGPQGAVPHHAGGGRGPGQEHSRPGLLQTDREDRVGRGPARRGDRERPLGPWPLYEAFEVVVQEVDPQNPHWDHIRQLQAATAKAMQRRGRNRWSRRDSEEGGDDA